MSPPSPSEQLARLHHNARLLTERAREQEADDLQKLRRHHCEDDAQHGGCADAEQDFRNSALYDPAHEHVLRNRKTR